MDYEDFGAPDEDGVPMSSFWHDFENHALVIVLAVATWIVAQIVGC